MKNSSMHTKEISIFYKYVKNNIYTIKNNKHYPDKYAKI